MSLPKITDLYKLTDLEIAEEIIETEIQLFNLRFKKATRQSFKSHEIKHAKHRLAQLKTFLAFRLRNEANNNNIQSEIKEL